jgi:peptidoglycan/xylan/chitin deacetylase (PgdA/CDA1 family)
MARTAVLTYHSHNISGTTYETNDHVALARDLDLLHSMDVDVVPLSRIVERVATGRDDGRIAVGLTFDDGPLFDFADFDHPRFGHQRGFLNILRDFRAARGVTALPALHATSFVIASPDARKAMEVSEGSGYTFLRDWLDDGWWREAAATGLMDIGNHSWDHVHHAFDGVVIRDSRRDDFSAVDNFEDAEKEIRAACEYIGQRLGRAPAFFAYPFGHMNDFLVKEYLPKHGPALGLRGAFAAGGLVPEGDGVWAIPRAVCGYHWRSPGELARLVAG